MQVFSHYIDNSLDILLLQKYNVTTSTDALRKGATMADITIYHGSPYIVKTPDISKSRYDTDFGRGFYCTCDAELAKEWACDERRSGYINSYTIDTSNLRILDLHDEIYSPLNWLALLVNNRAVRVRTPLQRRAIEWLKNEYLVDVDKFDIVVGYRADDSYFSIVRAFVMNSISLEQLTQALHLGGWGDQFVIKSKKAYSLIHYLESVPVDHKVYYPKRKKRNDESLCTHITNCI